MEKQFIFGKL